MDPYTSQIIANGRLDDLRAEGARSRAARSASRTDASLSLPSRLAALAVAWRSRRVEAHVAGQVRRPSSSRPA